MHDEHKQEESQSESLSKKERRELRREERAEREAMERLRRERAGYGKWIGLAVVLLIVGWGVTRSGGGSVETHVGETTSIGNIELYESDWEKGNPDASVVIVEYSDFQCPACAQYYPIVSRLMEDMGDDVRFVYRHFPLRQIHPRAQLAGQASEAGGVQGKFWEMHDRLFETQNTWTRMSEREARDYFISLAVEVGLDENQFKADMKSDLAEAGVDDDFSSAVQLGVNSTPTFFINGDKIPNPRGYEAFRALVQQYVASAPVEVEASEEVLIELDAE